MHALRMICLGTVLLLSGCPKSAPEVRVGVDESLKDLGLAEFLRAAYEESTKDRLSIEYLDTYGLQAAAVGGKLDYALVVSEATREDLDAEGIPIRSVVVAHEELIYIGPFENLLGDHIEAADAVGILQAMSRTNYKYLKARRGSVERARHELLFKKSGDRIEPGSFFESKLQGEALVKQAIEANAFALVKRSAILQAAKAGVRPHRIYREGDAELVLRLVLVEVHPGKTRMHRRPGLYDFLTGEAGTAVLRSFGSERFGYPVYGLSEPPEGQGASVPKLPGPTGGSPRP